VEKVKVMNENETDTHFNKIRTVLLEKKDGTKELIDVKDVESIKIVFGPHHFFYLTEKNDLSLILGATHHGFEVKANEVNGELEEIINYGREHYKNVD